MKYWLFFLTILCLAACAHQKDNIIGTWTVQSKFYQATYQIIPTKKSWNGLVLHYNDGTTAYQYQRNNKKRYLFKGLYQKDSVYLDGYSGATTKNKKQQTIKIYPKHQDTLVVTTYIQSHPIQEIWVRKK